VSVREKKYETDNISGCSSSSSRVTTKKDWRLITVKYQAKTNSAGHEFFSTLRFERYASKVQAYWPRSS
jgi:hypothetical protein